MEGLVLGLYVNGKISIFYKYADFRETFLGELFCFPEKNVIRSWHFFIQNKTSIDCLKYEFFHETT